MISAHLGKVKKVLLTLRSDVVSSALSCQVVLKLLYLLAVLLQLHFKLLYQTPEITKNTKHCYYSY